MRWSSDRPEVAVVREGVVDALSPGHAVMTATAPWGKNATADVFVTGDLVLTSNRGGSYGIYQTRVSGPGGLLPVLADSATNIQAVLSPDRTRIAFSSDRAGGNYDIYLIDADGRNLKRLTSNPGNEGEPAWTPDGKRIVYTSTTGATTQIALASLEGSDHPAAHDRTQQELVAFGLARRPHHRVRFHPRRQPGDLHDGSRRE